MKRSAVLLLVCALFAGARAFECPGAGQFASAPCSGDFFNCDAKGEVLDEPNLSCPGNTVFNQEKSACDYRGAVEACPVEAGKCTGEGNFPVGNCEAKYNACDGKGADPIVMPCPEGTFFNDANDQCDFKDEVLGCVCTSVTALAKATPELSILSAALEATGANATLNNAWLDVTVFAPTNTAFEALLAFLDVNATELLADTKTVEAVLGVHVTAGTYLAKDLTLDLGMPSLLPGQNITVTQLTPTVKVAAPGGEAGNVIKADITACSATVHVIDRVLLPKLD